MGDRSQRRWMVLGGITAVVALGFLLFGRPRVVTPEQASDAPSFIEETSTAGIEHVYDGDFEFFVGGGVAAFDCNDDRQSDLYIAGGANPAGLFINTSVVGGELSFEEEPGPTTGLTDVLGAYPIDVDADGHTDLAVLRLGKNVMLRGLGGCQFEEANELWDIDGGDQWTAAFAAAFESADSGPMMAFGNYLEWPVDRTQAASCADNMLVRPGGGTYQTVVLAPGWCTLSVLFSDWDRSGRTDLRVANDRHYYVDGAEQLWEIVPGSEPQLYENEDGWSELRVWGMGLAGQDVTGDGIPEYFITSQGDNKLQTLDPGGSGPTYGDIAIRRGVTAHRPFVGDESLPSTAWHPEFQDVNNDGFVDLFLTKGNVEAMAEYAMVDPNNLLIGQPDGTFVEGAGEAGVASVARSRGAAVVDFNLDGALDLVVVNRTEDVQIWRNVGDGDSGNWLAIELSSDGTNPDAIGAWVDVEIGDHTMSSQLTIGGGHAGDQLGWIHFGLGESERAAVTVQWPDGSVETWHDVDANNHVLMTRGGGMEYWQPDGG